VGTDTRSVRAGLALLGLTGVEGDRALITRLGLLDALTLYAAYALTKLPGDGPAMLLELGDQVSGWGRVHVVRRLLEVDRPDVRRWLLRGGADAGHYLTEEHAYRVAVAAGLRDALEGSVDDELYDGASELVRALVMGGPAEDLSDYEDVEPMLRAFLGHARSVRPTLPRLRALADLERYLSRETTQNPHLSQQARGELLTMVAEVLDEQRWAEFVARSLAGDDFDAMERTLRIGERYGIDPRPIAKSWLTRKPFRAYLWAVALKDADDEERRSLYDLAVRLLPLGELANGPDRDLGMGPGYQADRTLGTLIQDVDPRWGWPLVRVALVNRVTRTRRVAVRNLAAWPRDEWPDEASEVLTQAMWREPDEKLRQEMREVLDP
jgi:hypothetical protein